MLVKSLQIQRRATYDSNPGALYGSIIVTGHGGTQEINLSGKAMVKVLDAIQAEVVRTATLVAKDVPIAFQNTVGELELIEHPLAQIEEK